MIILLPTMMIHLTGGFQNAILSVKWRLQILIWWSYLTNSLTHCGLMMPYDIRLLGQHWFRFYVNHCWIIDNWTHRKKLQWNLTTWKQLKEIHAVSQKIAEKIFSAKMVAILFGALCVKLIHCWPGLTGGWVTYICIGKLTIIGSDNGLPPGRRQAIIWTSAGILLTGPLRTNFNEILIRVQTFSLKNKVLREWQHPSAPRSVNE